MQSLCVGRFLEFLMSVLCIYFKVVRKIYKEAMCKIAGTAAVQST
jgi:hypothetical protein